MGTKERLEILRDKIKCPQFGDNEYGEWGSLKLEQREAIKDLIDSNKNKDKTINDLLKRISNLEFEIERLNEELEVAKTNEETYRLEMLDITKRLGLDEETLFDDVKDKAERLNNVINEIEKDLEDRYYGIGKYNLSTDIVGIPTFLNRIKEIKGSNEAIPPEVIGTNGEDGGLFDYGDR